MNLLVFNIEAIDNKGMNHSGNVVRGLPGGDFLNTVFKTEEGNLSMLVEGDDDNYFMVHVETIIEPVLRSLDTVRGDVENAIRKKRQADQAETAAKEIVDYTNNGMSISAAFSKVIMGDEVKIESTQTFKRNGDGALEKIPSELIEILFDQVIGKGGYVRGVDGFVVGVVSNIMPANVSLDTGGINTLRDTLINSIRFDLVEQLAASLQDEYAVSINRAAVDQVLNY